LFYILDNGVNGGRRLVLISGCWAVFHRYDYYYDSCNEETG